MVAPRRSPSARRLRFSARRHRQGTQHDELVIGLVGAVGTNLPAVASDVGVVLGGFGYRSETVGLSTLLQELNWDQDLRDDLHDEHVWTYMEAGNELCRRWRRDDALALLAVAKIAACRADAGFDGRPLHRTAFVLRSLKRPEEVEFLRGVYGSRFVLIAAYSSRQERLQKLADEIARSYQSDDPSTWSHSPHELVERDEDEGVDGGQNVRDTYHRADLFVETRAGAKPALKRFFGALFGDPKITPNKDEFGLFQAEAAALRSAEMGRQVGAAIATDRGQILAVGVNEVPRFGGGAYWPDDTDVPDAREIAQGQDTNDVMKRELAATIAKKLEGRRWITQKASMQRVVEEISRTRLGDLIEFGRATHAEMAAISDAARTGVAINRCTLYTTTFPCHNCTRHIITAGIVRVVYVAPYAKSLARELHSDAVSVAARMPDKVNFEPFVGVAPRRYMEVFKWEGKRKASNGELKPFEPKAATPRLADLDPDELVGDVPPYLVREALVTKLLTVTQERTGLGVVVAEIEEPLVSVSNDESDMDARSDSRRSTGRKK